MGVRIASRVLCLGFLLANASAAVDNLIRPRILTESFVEPNPLDSSKRIFVGSAPSSPLHISPTNYVPYNVKLLPFHPEDAVDRYGKSINSYNNGYGATGSFDDGAQQFASIEQDSDRYNDGDFQNEEQFVDTNGYKHYNTQTSFSLSGPKQLETITTKSYHKEVEPYGVEEFKHHEHDHIGDEEHAEVHYHQHKHLHKHSHSQSHVHKHKGEHKHEHGHKHGHSGQHTHAHESQHKHAHQGLHKHEHKGEHKHQHQSHHKHSHSGQHSHDHKHNAEHKHSAQNAHKHSHHDEHKHSHHAEHSHDHHHGHSHHSDHKHKHHDEHKHSHGHEHKHKHDHKSKHKHGHKHYKH